MWSDHYQFCLERAEAVRVATQEFEQKQKREDRGWFSDMQAMDRVMAYEKKSKEQEEAAKKEAAKKEAAKKSAEHGKHQS